MKKKIIIIGISVVVISLIGLKLSSNYNKINAGEKKIAELPYVSVNVAPVQYIKFKNNIQQIGTLEAFKELNIMSEVQGKIVSLHIKEGQNITKGNSIAIIDKRLKELALQTAKNNVNKLSKDYERYKNLFAGNGVTEQDLDDIKNRLELAKIEYEQAKKQLADATVKSPITGIISNKKVESGDFVNVGSSIATIVDISKLKVKLNISETNVYKLHCGDKATITTDIYPGVGFTGYISFVSPKGDSNHTYPVEIILTNNSSHPLKAGSFVNVIINKEDKGNSLCIPRPALQGSISDAKVYVAQNGKAILRDIVVSNGDNDYLKIISGLKDGDQVVITGQVNLSDGKAIKIIKQ